MFNVNFIFKYSFAKMTFKHFEKFDMISVYIESGKNEEMAQNIYFVRYPERR